MTLTRRTFGYLAALAGGATWAMPRTMFAWEKPNSVFAGVQVGTIAPYSYHSLPNDAASILTMLVRDGISGIELQSTCLEEWAGAPKAPPRGRPILSSGPIKTYVFPKPTPEEAQRLQAYNESLRKWRLALPMSKVMDFRKMYNGAGVSIYAFKLVGLGLPPDTPDEEIEYLFQVAKTLGATQLTMELPAEPGFTKRMGDIATKQKLMVGYHAHLQARPDTWNEAMAESAWNGINLDIGHYTAAGNHDLLQFIEKNHARITSMHVKDRKTEEHGGENQPWGQGDTPIREVLQLVKRNRYTFPVTIELEYPVPAGSDSEKEVVKCMQYIRTVLTS